MPKRFLLSLTIACLLLPLATAYAQTTATIRGRVADPQDAIVVGATVVALNEATGIEQRTTTTSDGLYTIPALPSGTYDVRVEAANFAKGESKGVKLQVGDTRDVNFKLRVATATSVVEVTGEAPLVETTKTEGSTVLNSTDIARLPALSTNNLPSSAAGNMNDYAALAVGAPGVRFDLTGDSADLIGPGQFNNRSNQYNVDGGNMGDITTVGRTALGASVEEVKEFQVLTNNYNAEYGQAGGLIINVVTKSGTNTIHGDFHTYFRGTNMEGIPYFTKLSGALSPPPFFKHETGFTLGGPVIKDKTFWFLSYEHVSAGVPLPLPPPVNQTVTQSDDELQWSAKVDHEINSKNHFTGRFSVNRLRISNQLVQTPAATFPNGLVGDVGHDHTMNLAVTSTLTPHVVNEARVVWHRFLGPQTPANTTLPGQETSDAYFGADFAAPQGGLQNRYTGSDNLTWTRGAHTLKAGVKMDYIPWNALFSQIFYGEWINQGCAYPMTPIGGACPPKTFQFGTGSAFNVAKDNIYAWFVQDSWKLKPNLTMNYGVRYDYEAGAFKGGRIPVNGSFGNGCLQSNGIIPACGSDKNNFQPRLGFAWSPRFDSGLMGKLFGGHDKSVISAAFSEITQLAYNNIALDALNFDGINLRTVSSSVTDTTPSPAAVAALFASFPNFPSPAVIAPFVPPCPPSCGRVRPTSPAIRNPETRNVQLTWQRELSNSMVMSIGYLGSFGFGQFGEFDTNYPTILLDSSHSAANCPKSPGAGSTGCYYYAGARPDPRFDAERTNFSNRNSAYNGLVVSVEKRYTNHLQFAGNYAWSHLFSSTEGFYGVSEPFNPFNVRQSTRGPAEEDARHLANFRFTVDTDKRFHGSRWLSGVLNDWAFSLIGTAQSGRPWPISTGDGVFSGSTFFGFGAESTQAPNVLADGSLSTAGIAGLGSNMLISGNVTVPGNVAGTTICPTCKANTFAAPAGASTSGPVDMFSGQPVDFQYISGNVGRNQGVGDPYVRGDVSLRRAFRVPVREGIVVELRADLFNFANHTNFWAFNGGDILSGLTPCGTSVKDASGNLLSFTPAAGCPGGAGLDVTTGHYLGSSGQVLTLADLKHGRVSSNLNNKLFNGLGDPAGADIPRQAQLSIHVTW